MVICCYMKALFTNLKESMKEHFLMDKSMGRASMNRKTEQSTRELINIIRGQATELSIILMIRFPTKDN